MEPFMLIAAIAGFGVLALVLGVASLLNGNRQLNARLATFVSTSNSTLELPVHASDDDPEDGIAERLGQQLNRIGFVERIQRDLTRANLPLTTAEYFLIKLASTLLPVGVVLLAGGALAALPLVALIGFFIPSIWVRQRLRRRGQLFDDQLPETLAALIGSLRGGYSLVQSLGNVAREAPEPTATELSRAVQEIQFGLSVNDAMTNLAQRTASHDLELIVAVLKIHSRVGGNLTTVLESISTTIRERVRLTREIRVITSQQRYASYVLGLLPVILGVILLVINPTYMQKLFVPGWTLCIPFGAVVCNVIGFVVIQRIVDIKV